MATVIGYVNTIQGVFFAKNAAGELRQLEQGSPIYEGEVVVGRGQAGADQLTVAMVDGGEVVQVTADKPIKFAAAAETEGQEGELAGVQAVAEGEANFADVEALIADLGLEETETAAGAGTPTTGDDGLNLGSFDTRTGDSVNVTTGLFEGPVADTGVELTATATLPPAEETVTTTPTANDVPEIGDLKVMLPNEAGYQVGLIDSIRTAFSADGGNTFSWLPEQAKVPELFVDGVPVEIVFDNEAATVRGVIGNQDVFTIAINMQDNDGTDFVYQQADVLLESKQTFSSSINLSEAFGTGSYQHQLMTYNGVTDNAFSAVVRVFSHDNKFDSTAVLSGTSTIGVDNPTMDYREWLSLDFVGVGLDNLNFPSPAEYYATLENNRTPVAEVEISVTGYDAASGDDLEIRINSIDPDTGMFGYESVSLSDFLTTDGSYLIKASNGWPMTTLGFYTYDGVVGAEFQLHIESVTTHLKIADVAMQFGYQITDADGDFDQGTLYLNLDSNDNMKFEGDYDYIDGSGTVQFYPIETGEEGPILERAVSFGSEDVLEFGNEFANIDFSLVGTEIKNIEVFDLSASADQSIVNLSLEDVINMTDEQNLLKIRLSDGDAVSFSNPDEWALTPFSPVREISQDGYDGYYDMYTNVADTSVSVMIETTAPEEMMIR